MSGKPLVSAVIIFLNAERFIQEAIESIFAQTYDSWELLLVDDGSTDASTTIARQYAKQNPHKVYYLEHNGHQNHGMSSSRNLGIQNAHGEYLAFLDADDIWLPRKLEKQVSILTAQTEAAMVYGPRHEWYSWTGRSEDIRRDSLLHLGVQPNTLIEPPTLLILFLGRKALTPATCGVLVRRKIVERIGGFEEDFRGLYEDQAFFYKLCLQEPVFVSGECWDRYRQHPDSHCVVAKRAGEFNYKEPHAAHLALLTWLAEYLSKREIKDTEVLRALRKSQWPYHHQTLDLLLRRARQLVRHVKAKCFSSFHQR